MPTDVNHGILNYHLFWSLGLATLEIIAAYFLGIFVRKLIVYIARRAKNKGIWTFFGSFANIFCKAIGLIIALDQLGVSMNLIIGAMSALGVGISLALKDNMASVASGLQLLLTKPFKVGDYIRMGKHEGNVRSIEITYTTLETRNNETVIIPNNSLIIKTIINFSNQPDRRIVIDYPSSKKDISKNEKELLHAAISSPLVLKDPAPSVRITSYQIDSATLELLAYTKPENYWECTSQIMTNIHDLQDQGLIDDSQLQNASSLQDNSFSSAPAVQPAPSSLQSSLANEAPEVSLSSVSANSSH